eukprot:198148-Amphidinium_carterae.1
MAKETQQGAMAITGTSSMSDSQRKEALEAFRTGAHCPTRGLCPCTDLGGTWHFWFNRTFGSMGRQVCERGGERRAGFTQWYGSDTQLLFFSTVLDKAGSVPGFLGWSFGGLRALLLVSCSFHICRLGQFQHLLSD